MKTKGASPSFRTRCQAPWGMSADALAREGVPVLAALFVALEAEPLAGLDDDALDLVVGLVGEDGVVAPGPVIGFAS